MLFLRPHKSNELPKKDFEAPKDTDPRILEEGMKHERSAYNRKMWFAALFFILAIPTLFLQFDMETGPISFKSQASEFTLMNTSPGIIMALIGGWIAYRAKIKIKITK